MIQNFLQKNDHFIYIDSSQGQDDVEKTQYRTKPEKYKRAQKSSKLSYNDSSSSGRDSFQSSNLVNSDEQNIKKVNRIDNSTHKLCKIKPDKFLLNDGYIKNLEKIIEENQQKLSKKTPLLLPDTDKEILENLQRRKKNYGFFLRTLEIDHNYNQILNNKVERLKQENQRKKKVLQKKKQKETVQQDQEQMKKFVIDKKMKEEIVLDKIQKHAYRLGIQRIRSEEQKIKSEIKGIDNLNDLKTVNLDIKQRNQIYQLRQQLEKIKQANRVNKVDQQKALKDMKKNVLHTKKSLIQKAQTAKQNKFII